MKFYGKWLINNTFVCFPKLNCAFSLLLGVNKADYFFFFSCDKGGQYNNTTLLMCSNRQRRTLQKMVCMDGSWVVKLPCNPKLQVRSLQRWLFLGFGSGHIYAPSSPYHSCSTCCQHPNGNGVFYRWSTYYILLTLWSIILSVLICQNDG